MNDMLISPYIIAIVSGWVGAHVIKYVVSVVRSEQHGLKSHLFRSGGMPSSHSTTVVALAMLVGLRDGFSSGLFGVSLLFALIVMYDAVKVRRSSGEQGEALRLLIKEQKSGIKLPRAAKGHSPIEVVAGLLLGTIIGLVVFLSTK